MLINLAMLDYDLAIREDPPEEPQPAEELNIIGEEYDNLMWAYNKKLANWEKSNRMCLIYVKGAISPEVIGGIIDSNDIKSIWQTLKKVLNLHMRLMPIRL